MPRNYTHLAEKTLLASLLEAKQGSQRLIISRNDVGGRLEYPAGGQDKPVGAKCIVVVDGQEFYDIFIKSQKNSTLHLHGKGFGPMLTANNIVAGSVIEIQIEQGSVLAPVPAGQVWPTIYCKLVVVSRPVDNQAPAAPAQAVPAAVIAAPAKSKATRTAKSSKAKRPATAAAVESKKRRVSFDDDSSSDDPDDKDFDPTKENRNLNARVVKRARVSSGSSAASSASVKVTAVKRAPAGAAAKARRAATKGASKAAIKAAVMQASEQVRRAAAAAARKTLKAEAKAATDAEKATKAAARAQTRANAAATRAEAKQAAAVAEQHEAVMMAVSYALLNQHHDAGLDVVQAAEDLMFLRSVSDEDVEMMEVE